jgi:hypothetical protein
MCARRRSKKGVADGRGDGTVGKKADEKQRNNEKKKKMPKHTHTKDKTESCFLPFFGQGHEERRDGPATPKKRATDFLGHAPPSLSFSSYLIIMHSPSTTFTFTHPLTTTALNMTQARHI